MKAVDFLQAIVVIAENQPEYEPLPAHVDGQGTATFCWQLSWRERWSLLFGGKLWHSVMTGGGPLQPQLLAVYKPSLYMTMQDVRMRKALEERMFRKALTEDIVKRAKSQKP